jgi:hypothetical protein
MVKTLLSALLVIGLATLSSILPTIATAQEDSLILYLPFDTESKDEIKDLSKHENHATVSGNPKWDKGKIGNALTFDATDDQVVVPTSKSLDITDKITMMAWVNPDKKLMEDWRTIVGKSPTNVLGQVTFAYDIRTDKAGNYRFSLNIGAWQSLVGPIAEIGKWTHVAGTYDGKEMVLYLNGVGIDKKLVNGKIKVIGDPVGIGNIVDAGGAGKNEYWAGLIDEVKIWNRGLSDKEVKQQMNLSRNDILAVNPQAKLTTTWAKMKRGL